MLTNEALTTCFLWLKNVLKEIYYTSVYIFDEEKFLWILKS